ncbi:MAG: hypothetical protein C5B58_12425 [Acidobacteria bacterium]|nr:MAG: hypothetical protein C5B58_12425 [Acidobacteriota bacterium]
MGNPNEREIANAFTEPEKALFLLRGIHSPSFFVWSHKSGSAGEIDALQTHPRRRWRPPKP